jgi:hypothetical protein
MSDQTPEPVVHAHMAAAAVRRINHLTTDGDGGLTHPAHLADVLLELADAVGRLPQAFGQLARIANSHRGLLDDRGPDRNPGTTLDVATHLLTCTAAGLVGAQLRQAAALISHLKVTGA